MLLMLSIGLVLNYKSSVRIPVSIQYRHDNSERV